MSKKSSKKLQRKAAPVAPVSPAAPKGLSEDWLAVIIAFALILLAGIGLIGPNLINITF